MGEYYTLGSLLQFSGAVAAVALVTAAVGYLAGEAITPYLKWVALGMSMLLAYLGAVVAGGQDWTRWIVAFFNGLVLFLAAVGVNQLTTPKVKPVAMGMAMPGRKRFWPSWL